MTVFIKPEELAKTVGAARGVPPPLQLGGFVHAIGRVLIAPALQERCDCFKSSQANALFFSEVLHSLNLRHVFSRMLFISVGRPTFSGHTCPWLDGLQPGNHLRMAVLFCFIERRRVCWCDGSWISAPVEQPLRDVQMTGPACKLKGTIEDHLDRGHGLPMGQFPHVGPHGAIGIEEVVDELAGPERSRTRQVIRSPALKEQASCVVLFEDDRFFLRGAPTEDSAEHMT